MTLRDGLSEEQAALILEKGLTPRAKLIDTLQKYENGTIYNGRPDFLDDVSSEPVHKRKPSVQYMAVRAAIGSHSTKCLGDGRFPTVSSAPSEDDTDFDPTFGLSEADSDTLDTGVRKIVEQTLLDTVAGPILEAAMASRSVAVFGSIVNGRLRVSCIDAKTCEPEFDENDPGRVKKLVVSYRYTKRELDDQDHKFKLRAYQFRRVIDETSDVTYQPVEIENEKEFPTPDKVKTTYKHGFGFCPVVWYKFMATGQDTGDMDGRAIHDSPATHALIDAINVALSQRNRAAVYSGDPQMYETGVEPGEVRRPMTGANPGQNADLTRDQSGWDAPLMQNRARPGQKTKVKKGAGTLWSYESSEARLQLLTLGAEALACLDSDAKNNLTQLREDLHYVHLDPKDLTGSGDVSGKTLSFIFASQIAYCNKVRVDLWNGALLPTLGMLLRIVLVTQSGLYLAGAKKIRAVVQRFEQQQETIGGKGKKRVWFDPPLTPKWGEYFEPSDTDESTRIANATAAKSGGFITQATAIRHVQPIFPDIRDPEAYVKALEKEKDAEQAKQTADLHAASVAMNGGAGGRALAGFGGAQGGGSGGRGRGRAAGAPPAPSARGRSASAAPPKTVQAAPARRPASSA